MISNSKFLFLCQAFPQLIFQFWFAAAERLEDLQRELYGTQKQINDANRELSQIERDNMERVMTAEEKQKLRKRLAAKIQKVCQVINAIVRRVKSYSGFLLHHLVDKIRS